jgi:hypothetical protein
MEWSCGINRRNQLGQIFMVSPMGFEKNEIPLNYAGRLRVEKRAFESRPFPLR